MWSDFEGTAGVNHVDDAALPRIFFPRDPGFFVLIGLIGCRRCWNVGSGTTKSNFAVVWTTMNLRNQNQIREIGKRVEKIYFFLLPFDFWSQEMDGSENSFLPFTRTHMRHTRERTHPPRKKFFLNSLPKALTASVWQTCRKSVTALFLLGGAERGGRGGGDGQKLNVTTKDGGGGVPHHAFVMNH